MVILPHEIPPVDVHSSSGNSARDEYLRVDVLGTVDVHEKTARGTAGVVELNAITVKVVIGRVRLGAVGGKHRNEIVGT